MSCGGERCIEVIITDPLIFTPGQRIVIVGNTGTGKTTLARQLADRMGALHIEMDALHWEPNWTEAPLDVFRDRLSQATTGDTWTLDGNYSKVRDIAWGRADTIIWLDFSLWIILPRLLRRTLRRVIRREELWGGNRETWRGAFFSRDSLFLWALSTYRRRKRSYLDYLSRPEYAHLKAVRFRSPRALKRWLDSHQ